MVLLESIDLFRNLGPAELQALCRIVQEKHYAANSEIVRESDPGDGVYFVKEGLVEISGLIAADTRRVFARLGPGEVFGEMAVIEQSARSATATAIQETDVYFIPRSKMLSFIKQSPALSFGLLQLISRRLREFDQLYIREVVQAERLALVGNFARSIIHDLKNPLSVISLSAEMFGLGEVSPEAQARARGRIGKEVQRIVDMVNDILIFSEGKRKNVEMKPADYRAFMVELIAELGADAKLRNARIEMKNEPPAVLIPFDPHRLARVFHNLFRNSIEVMAAGGSIFLRFQRDEKEIITEIEDTGPGIAPEMAGRLFEAFATFGKRNGTGLGLSICKKIIEDHNGRIWARNKPGGGAIFAFSLPLS